MLPDQATHLTHSSYRFRQLMRVSGTDGYLLKSPNGYLLKSPNLQHLRALTWIPAQESPNLLKSPNLQHLMDTCSRALMDTCSRALTSSTSEP